MNKTLLTKNDLDKITPNSGTREEFLVVLEYLLQFATSEKTATINSKIAKYAKEQYKLTIRRDRISDILLHISQLYVKYPEKFPFNLHSISFDRNNNKYFVTDKFFSDKELMSIIASLYTSNTLDKNSAKKIINKVNKLFCDKNRKEKINSIFIGQTDMNQEETFSKQSGDFLSEIMEAKQNDECVWFTITQTSSRKIKASDPDVYRNNKDKSFVGFPYSFNFDKNNKIDIVFYLHREKCAFIVPLERIVVQKHQSISSFYDRHVEISYILKYKDRPNEHIDEFIKRVNKDDDKSKHEIEFKFKFANTAYNLRKIGELYKKSYNKEIEYVNVPRETCVAVKKEDGTIEKKHYSVNDAVVSVKCDFNTFYNFYYNINVMDCVVILEPSFLNDYFLADITRRFVRRLSVYGQDNIYKLDIYPKQKHKEHRYFFDGEDYIYFHQYGEEKK